MGNRSYHNHWMVWQLILFYIFLVITDYHMSLDVCNNLVMHAASTFCWQPPNGPNKAAANCHQLYPSQKPESAGKTLLCIL